MHFGCYKNHLYVQQEWVDANFLASSKVQTPDPRQANPPHGQRLIIAWDFPQSLFQENLHLVATVRFWNNSQESIRRPLERKRDVVAFYFAEKTPDWKILTYRVQIFAADGHLVEEWDHHFWTELINVGREDNISSPQSNSDSVSSQPMQASVMDNP